MLGFWEEGATDLRTASNLDYDEDIGAMLRKVFIPSIYGHNLMKFHSSIWRIVSSISQWVMIVASAQLSLLINILSEQLSSGQVIYL